MDEYSKKLYMQIVETYGRILYTYQSYIEMSNFLKKMNDIIKLLRIILSTLMTGSFLTLLFANYKYIIQMGTILSIVLLAINLYYKESNFQEKINIYNCASNDLWLIKEEYISLLIDFEHYNTLQIQNMRNELTHKLDAIYRKYLKTSNFCFKIARFRIRKKEIHTFAYKEFAQIMPSFLLNDINNTEK